jgi:formate dehydrogenase subunit delta
MHIENLVQMLNQIESFFAAESDHDLAVEGVRSHLARFWEPRMRRIIIAHVAAGGEGVGELAKEAVRRLEPVKAA